MKLAKKRIVELGEFNSSCTDASDKTPVRLCEVSVHKSYFYARNYPARIHGCPYEESLSSRDVSFYSLSPPFNLRRVAPLMIIGLDFFIQPTPSGCHRRDAAASARIALKD